MMNRTRDFFPAQVISILLNNRRQEKSDKIWNTEEILDQRYPRLKGARPDGRLDPDRGAGGNWKELKANLKGVTKRADRKKAKRKVFREAPATS